MSKQQRNSQSIKVRVTSIQSYKQSYARNYKYISLEDILINLSDGYLNNKVETKTSRYEVLSNITRKLYFDIENIPTDQPDLIHQIANDINIFIKNKDPVQVTEDLKFVKTINYSSSTHTGLSYHLICYNYCMNVLNLKGLVKEFLATSGSKYNSYIDPLVYSKIRLFKLPYYLGIIKDKGLDTNLDNYHRFFDYNDEDLSSFVIQYVENIPELSIEYQKVNTEGNSNTWSGPIYHTSQKKLAKETMKLCNMIYENLQSKKTELNINLLNLLYENKDKLNNVSRNIINKIYTEHESNNITPTNITSYNALMENIRTKFNINDN